MPIDIIFRKSRHASSESNLALQVLIQYPILHRQTFTDT